MLCWHVRGKCKTRLYPVPKQHHADITNVFRVKSCSMSSWFMFFKALPTHRPLREICFNSSSHLTSVHFLSVLEKPLRAWSLTTLVPSLQMLSAGLRRSQQGQRREPRKIITNVSVNEVQLKKAENAWKPTLKRDEEPCENKTQVKHREKPTQLDQRYPFFLAKRAFPVTSFFSKNWVYYIAD